MKKDNQAYLKHILDAITRIEEYVRGISEGKFLSKNIIQSAVIREIEIIGEATKMLDSKFKNNIPQVPWKEISGMRDKLIHHYFGVDNKAVWKTVKEDLPPLKKQIRLILEKKNI